jgi:hypothetical protein
VGSSAYGGGLAADVAAFADTLATYPWTELADARNDPHLSEAVDKAERYLKELKKALDD